MKLTAETEIRSDRNKVWQFSQTPELHSRWDIRFTSIEYLPRKTPESPQHFRYATRLGFGMSIEGWGESVGLEDKSTSALRFGSDDPKSLIREGSGSWTYHETGETVRFGTIYDYQVRYALLGRMADFVFRPMMRWAVRWSFDRLRIWIERGTAPEALFRLWFTKVATRWSLGLIWIYEGIVPKILAQRPSEIALVTNSKLFWGSPSTTLAILGVIEMCFGIWLLSGRGERVAVALSALGVVSLASLVAIVDSSALSDPLGGLSKNLALLGCALTVWVLSEYSPLARRARPLRRRAKNRQKDVA